MNTMSTHTTPRVYVGTYAKYNNGSIAGAWLDLTEYADKDAFLAACAELHKDEADPELMFQDFEGFPEAYYGESCIKDELWDWIALDDDDRKVLTVYTKHIDQSGDIDRAREAFMGKYDSESAWAEQWLDDSGMLCELPEWAKGYFDFEAYARDACMGGEITFVRHEGDLWVFNNNV